MNKPQALRRQVAGLPDAPGVYIFKDARGQIIYIGKAKSLKKRAQSYFTGGLNSKTQAMAAKIASLEYKVTPTESQAQILEASLIKGHQPQYNTSLKDDKSFPWIKITAEDYPVVSIDRKKRKDNADTSLYYGPYTNTKLLRQAVKLIRRIFGFRSCKKMPNKACLYGRLKLCPAPCVGKISPGEYQKTIRRIKLFLESRQEDLLRNLSEEMGRFSAERRFEEAARVRDQINALSAIGRPQAGINLGAGLAGLRKLLKLGKLPARIEAFDISNIFGKEACGAMVSFYKGLPDKDNYRRFRIKTVEGIDDYGMLGEVLRRRYARSLNEGLPLPDLILIDGGKAHLLVAERELKKLGLEISLVSIAKEQENIYIKNRIRPIRLKSDIPALNLIRRVRDEAHRFAIKYHHLLRRKKIIGE